MGITRRQFLALTGVSAAGAVAFAGCTAPRSELTVESTARMPEDLITGIDTWYASLCRMCPAGCGIIVRVMEGRAKKIEGNPDYPVNRGKLCARGQAGLQVLYHPDRIRSPLRRSGPRGSGQFEPVSWEVALDELLGRLKPLQANGHLDQVTLITGPLRGHLSQVLARLASASKLQWATLDALDQSPLQAAIDQMWGGNTRPQPSPLPYFDIERARFILSFGADFLGTWLSPVQYGVAYSEFRVHAKTRDFPFGRSDRGILVQVEPRLSATGASADQWIPIKPGAEGALALGLAQVIISEGLVPEATAQRAGFSPALLEGYRPQAVAQATGIPEGQIVDLARRLANQKPSLVIGGGPAAAHSNGRFNLEAIYSLNRLVLSAGQFGGVLVNPRSPLPEVAETAPVWPLSSWRQLVEAIGSGQPQGGAAGSIVPPQVLLLRGANPVHDLPPALGLREALDKVPFIVSFSSFMDDTSALADLVLPEHTYLEDWGSDIPEPAPGFQVLGFQQPVVNPLYDTRSFGDTLLTLAEGLGLGQQLPWKSYKEVLREGAQGLFRRHTGSIQASSFEEYWMRLLQGGGWWDETALPGPQSSPIGQSRSMEPASPKFVGSEQEYPFHLLPFPSASLGEGSGSHLPWLQAMPDPITTAVWMTWVEVNLETAKRLDLREGDIVRVESPQGSLEAPIYIQPGLHPEVIAIPMGQGHTVFGRYAQGRGANVMDLLAATSGDNESLAWAATRVRLAKTGKSVRVSKAEGSVMPVAPPDEEIVEISRT